MTRPSREAVEAAFDRTACSYAIGRKGGLDQTYIISRSDFLLLRAEIDYTRAIEDAAALACIAYNLPDLAAALSGKE